MKTRIIIAILIAAALASPPAAYLISTSIPCRASVRTSTSNGGAWSNGTPLPTARSEIAAAVLDGRIYVAGGLQGAATTAAFEVYDPAQDAWRAAAALPVALHHLGLAAANGRVYVTGGFADLTFGQLSAAAWAYDPGSDAWEQVASMPAQRAAHTMAALDGKLYVVGGVPDATALWAYDPAADVWETALAPMPTAREHLASAAVDGKLYVVGGRWSGEGNLDALEVYDPATDNWESLTAMPTPRGGLAAAAIGGRVVVAGGENPWARWGTGCAYTTVEAYDTAGQMWSRLADLPTPLHGLASGVADNRWYIVGGGMRPTFGTFFSLSDRVLIYAPE